MANADGQIILGLNVNATRANIQNGLDGILGSLKTRQLILKAAIEKSEAERSIDALVKNINKKTAKLGIAVDAKDVNKVLAEQQKIASMQEKLKKQMQEYRNAAKELGITLNKSTWNGFNQAIKAQDFDKAKKILSSAQKQISSYEKSVSRMNADASISGRITTTIAKFNQLGNVTAETQKKVSLLKSTFTKFENATSVNTKLNAYKKLNTLLGQLGNEYKQLQTSEKAATKDSSVKSKLADAETLLDTYRNKYAKSNNTDTVLGKSFAKDLNAAGLAIDAFNKKRSKLSGGSLASEFSNVESAVKNATRSFKEFSVEQSTIDKLSSSLERVSNKLKAVSNPTLSFNDSETYGKVKEFQDKVADIQASIKALDTTDASAVNKVREDISALSASYDEISEKARTFSNANVVNQYSKNLDKAYEKLAQYSEKNSAIRYDASLTDDFKKLQSKLVSDVDSPQTLSAWNTEFEKFNKKVVEAGLNTQSFSAKLKSAFTNFSAFFGVSRAIYEASYRIRQMIENVTALDTAMVELKKVTDSTEQGFESYLTRAKSTASEIGSTVTDYVNSTADFSRLGYSLQDAEELAKVATIYQNVGDDINSIDDASGIIITTMKAFDMEASDAMSVIDKLNEVGNNYAISSGDLGEGLTKSASYMATAGNSLDETIAMITAMTEITQDATESGNALKILAMRLRGAKVELSEAGEDTDGMAESTSSLREKILALTNVTGDGGFDIMLNEDEFKSTYEIMQGLSEVWDDMTDINQASLIELIAGKHRGNSITALLTSMSQAENVLTTSLNSSGSAMKEEEVWLDSIEAKVAQFKASFESLSSTVFSSDFLKGFLDGATDFITFIDNAIQKLGGLRNAVTLVGSALTLFNIKKSAQLFGDIFSKLNSTLKVSSFLTELKQALPIFSRLKEFSSSGGGFFNSIKTNLTGAQKAALGLGSALAVVGVAYAAISAKKQKIQERHENLISDAESYTEQSESLENLKAEFAELRTAIDSGTLSSQEIYEKKSRLVEIEQSLIDMFGLEAQSLDLVTGSIENQSAALDNLEKSAYNRFQSQNEKAIDTVKDVFSLKKKDTSSWWNDVDNYASISLPGKDTVTSIIENLSLNTSYDEFYEDIVDEIQKAIPEITSDDFMNGGLLLDVSDMDIYELLDAYQKVYDIVDKLGGQYFGENSHDYLSSFFTGISDKISATSDVISENEDVFNTYVEGLLNYDKTYSDVWSKALAAQQEYNDAILNGDDDAAAAAIQKMQAAQQAFLDAGWDNEAVNTYMKQFFDEWNDSTEDYQIELNIKADLEDSKNGLKEQLTNLLGEFEDDATGKIDLASILSTELSYDSSDGLTKQELAYKSLKEKADEYNTSVENLVNTLAKLGYISLEGTETAVDSVLTKLQKSYDSLKTSTENAMTSQTAMSDVFLDNTYLTEDVYNAISSLVGNEQKLADCIDTSNGYLVTNATALQKVVAQAERALMSDIELAEAHERLNYHELAQELYDATGGMEGYNAATSESINTILSQMDATKQQIAQYKLLEQQLLGTTNAFSELENAQSIDEAADYTDELSSAISTLIESYENSEFGTETFRTAFEALVPEDVYDQFTDAGDQIDAGWEYLQDKLSRYFTFDESSISIDASNIEQFVSDALSTSFGDSTVLLGDLEDFDLNPQIESLDEFADAMNVTEEAAFALATGISKYTTNNGDFLDSLMSGSSEVEKLDYSVYEADQKMQELLETRNKLLESGEINTDDWLDVQEQISEVNNSYEEFADEARETINASIEIDADIEAKQDEVDSLKEKLDELDKEDASYSAKLEDYTTAQNELATLLQEKYQLGEPTELTVSVALESVQAEIDSVKTQIEAIATYDGKTYTLKANVDASQTDLDALVAKLQNLNNEKVQIEAYANLDDESVLSSLSEIEQFTINDKDFTVSATDNSSTVLGTIIGKLREIQSKSITVTTYERTVKQAEVNGSTFTGSEGSFAGGSAHANGNAYEKGDWGIPTQQRGALVGELGTELVVDPYGGTYRTVGDNGAEIVDLPKGAIIFNHLQTMALLRNKRINTRGKALAWGTAHAGFSFSNKKYTWGSSGTTSSSGSTSSSTSSTSTSTTSSSSSSGSSSSGSTYTVSVEADDTSLEESLEDTLDEMEEKFDEIIGNFEHKIFLLEKKSTDPLEIASIYKEMQQKVHEQAQEYRNLGLDENSDYIQDLQEKWWDFADSIAECYDNIVKENENAITLTENWLDKAIANNDYDAIIGYTSDIVGYYKKMQKTIHDQAEYYRNLGYSDTSDEVSELSDLWWDYQENILNYTTDTFAEIVETMSDAVDEIQDAYDTLKSAAKEYGESGFITVDTLQDIIELGTEYLAFLQDENGQLVINQENIQKVIAARTQQLAIESALNYIEQLRSALTNNQSAALENLLYATDAATSSTWKLVYAQLATLDLEDNQFQAALQRINSLRSLADIATTSISQVTNTITDSLEETSDYLDDILDYVIDMIKQEVEDRVDALNEQIDKYQEIVDLKKESLELTKDEDDYNKEVSDKLKDISKLQAQIQQLSLDDSREAKAEKAKLEEDLADLQEELTDKQNDYAYDATIDALDKQADAFEKEKNQEIEILEDSVSSYEKVYQLAIARISNHWDALYNDLLNWNYEYGSVTNDEITKAWNSASAAVQKYGSYLEAVAKTTAAINAASIDASASDYNVVAPSGDYSNDTQEVETIRRVRSIIDRMKANSAAWKGASNEEKERLNRENQTLGLELEKLIGRTVVRDNKSGVWYLDKIGGAKLYDAYHQGGVVGGKASLKDNETVAILEKGEIVLDDNKKQGLYRIVDAAEAFGDAFKVVDLLTQSIFGNKNIQKQRDDIKQSSAQMMERISNNSAVVAPQIDASVTIQGDVDRTVWDKIKPELKRHSAEVSEIACKELVSVYHRSGIR